MVVVVGVEEREKEAVEEEAEAEGLRRAEKAIGEAGPRVGRSNDWVEERGVVVVKFERGDDFGEERLGREDMAEGEVAKKDTSDK